ncbi:MAG: malate dehydrogenase [Spirochaetia bacterium]
MPKGSTRLSTHTRKITIVGSGVIGTTVAYSLLLRQPNLELVLNNRHEGKARARAFDISHCTPSLEGNTIRAGSMDDTAASDIVVVTAGVLPREDGTRSDVLRDNVEVYRRIIPPLAARNPHAVFIVVTNPTDSMAYAAHRLAGLPASRIIGTGTLLDGLRLRKLIAEACDLDPSKIEADVVGEHGDGMVALWSRASCAGIPLDAYLRGAGIDFDAAARQRIMERTRRAGWDIRLAGEHSCYGISFSVVRIIESILGASAAPLTVSSLISGELGIHDVYLSLPVTLDRAGCRSISVPRLTDEETGALRAAAAAMRSQLDAVDLQVSASS